MRDPLSEIPSILEIASESAQAPGEWMVVYLATLGRLGDLSIGLITQRHGPI